MENSVSATLGPTRNCLCGNSFHFGLGGRELRKLGRENKNKTSHHTQLSARIQPRHLTTTSSVLSPFPHTHTFPDLSALHGLQHALEAQSVRECRAATSPRKLHLAPVPPPDAGTLKYSAAMTCIVVLLPRFRARKKKIAS